jgi:hypothetical protein
MVGKHNINFENTCYQFFLLSYLPVSLHQLYLVLFMYLQGISCLLCAFKIVILLPCKKIKNNCYPSGQLVNLVAGSNFTSTFCLQGLRRTCSSWRMRSKQWSKRPIFGLSQICEPKCCLLREEYCGLKEERRTNEDLSHDFLFLTPNDIFSDAVLVAWIYIFSPGKLDEAAFVGNLKSVTTLCHPSHFVI